MHDALGYVAYGLSLDLDFAVIERARLSPAVIERFREHGVTLIDGTTGHIMVPAQGNAQPGRVTVLTSGTTGLLKLIPHSASSLNTFDRVQDLPPNCWFLPYQIGSYAWYQMVMLALFQPKQSLFPGDFNDLMASFEVALEQGVITAISSTPTFWRQALLSIDRNLLTRAPLRSLSMGGEIVDQPILDQLHHLYPQAVIRHIYASSEAGAAIVVSDGKAGFPAHLLDRDIARINLRVREGRLFVRSPYANRNEAQGWVDTGDLVERRGDRFYFLGRAGNTMINVGGQKAFPPDIEAHLMTHPDVLWARVTARKAPLMGSLPVASVVLAREIPASTAEQILTQYCETGLADYAVPRMWDFPDAIPMRASLKS
jgi:acyl-coenzyme A synthetase/AMP-(fatty) acid ligase